MWAIGSNRRVFSGGCLCLSVGTLQAITDSGKETKKGFQPRGPAEPHTDAPHAAYRTHRIQGHSPHHPVLTARLQFVEVPVCEQKGPVPALAEAVHLQEWWLDLGWCHLPHSWPQAPAVPPSSLPWLFSSLAELS